MKFTKSKSQIFVPSSVSEDEAVSRTTDLCIAAHQDDIEIMAYGPISECYGKRDKFFSGVVVSDGAGSPRTGLYESYTNEEMMDVRVMEQKNAASIGDYSFQAFLDFKSAEIKDKDLNSVIEDIEKIILLSNPQTVYTHNLADKHDTHIGVALRVIAAIRKIEKSKRPKKLFGMEVWRGLDWLCDEDKAVFDTSQRPGLAAALLGLFDSQVAGGKRYDAASIGRRLANATYFASHATDDSDSISFGIDMTELIENDDIEPLAFISKYIDGFKNEVTERLGRM